jgi:AbrB family looped-hinge helix DNA binding protein
MTISIMSSVSSTGRLTIPHKLRARLGLRGGSKVVLQEVADGVVLMSATSLSRPQIAERLLESLVVGVGRDAEQLGLEQEDDLAPLIEVIREQMFAERYGHAKTA